MPTRHLQHLDNGATVELSWSAARRYGAPTRLVLHAPQGITSELLRTIRTSPPRVAMPVARSVRVGRAGHPPRFYAELARDYVELVQQGDVNPIVTLARKQRVSTETVRSRAHAARSRHKMMTGPHYGLANRLTAKARRLLESAS